MYSTEELRVSDESEKLAQERKRRQHRVATKLTALVGSVLLGSGISGAVSNHEVARDMLTNMGDWVGNTDTGGGIKDASDDIVILKEKIEGIEQTNQDSDLYSNDVDWSLDAVKDRLDTAAGFVGAAAAGAGLLVASAATRRKKQ